MVLHPHTRSRHYCYSLGLYKDLVTKDLALAEYFWTPSSYNLLQDSPGDLPKLAQSPTALKNTGSFLLHPTTLHLNMLFISESQNITLLLVIFFCHTRVFLFVCFLKLSFFHSIFLNLALTDTEPIILNYSKNTFIATSSLSYMTQLRKSTLINPSMVTTLKQKKVCIVLACCMFSYHSWNIMFICGNLYLLFCSRIQGPQEDLTWLKLYVVQMFWLVCISRKDNYCFSLWPFFPLQTVCSCSIKYLAKRAV